MKPLAIDLYAGLGGWAEGLLMEGFQVIGFDIERHVYGEACYPAQLVLQDVRTLHGAQFKDAALIVGSSPCQEFSYRAMPWKRAKALPPPYLGMELFEAQFRIQREACEAAGRYIPMVVENVCGAQKWVGRARWHGGSIYLWGDVPSLMPAIHHVKMPGLDWNRFRNGDPSYRGEAFNTRRTPNKRESAAFSAKIPLSLSSWIAQCFKPTSSPVELLASATSGSRPRVFVGAGTSTFTTLSDR